MTEIQKRLLIIFLALIICSVFTGCAGVRERVVWTKSKQMPLNLTEHFNNDGLSSEANRRDGNFDCPDHPETIPGSTYPSDALPQTGSVFSVSKLRDVDFLFPSKLDGSENNVTCSGQKVEVPAAYYSELYVLGAAENGSAEAEMKFDYGGDKETVPVRFADWCVAPEPGEIPAFEFDHRHSWRGEEEEKECYLTIQKIQLDPTRKLEYMKLPYNSRIHIFSMTIKLVERDELCKVYAEDTLQLYQALKEAKETQIEDFEPVLIGIEERLEELSGAENPRFSRELQWLKARIMYCRHKMPRGKRAAPSVIRAFKRQIASVEEDMESLARGANPFPEKRGNFLRGYVSDIDGNLQTYSLTVPGEYTGEQPFPLIVSLHGHGWYSPFQGHPAPNIKGAIVVSPHGRGSVDYMFIGEEDVLTVIDEVKKDYNIDENRVYVTGRSMGGTGSWNLSVKYPDVFAAIGPIAGNADHHVWKKEWRWDFHGDSPFLGLLNYIEDTCDPASYAENLANIPVFCLHGEKDKTVPVGHARSMADKLRNLGYDLEYREFSYVGHGGFPYKVIEEQRDWMFSKVRNPHPKFVRYKTSKLRYAGSYWLKINQFTELVKFATIEGYCEAEGRFSIRQTNVSNFTLDISKTPLLDSPAASVQVGENPRTQRPRQITVFVDGTEAYSGPAPSDGLLTLRQGQDDKWDASEKPSGFIKRSGIEGPIEDAFMSPFLVVYGTTAESVFEREIIKAEADVFARDWERMYGSPCRIKEDSQVTEGDIEKYNLVLYGAPYVNSITARVMKYLPVKIAGNKVTIGEKVFEGPDVGAKFCYPNPLNQDRYVAVFAATTWRGMYQINNRFGNWFDWGVYDNRSWFDYAVFDGKTYLPETFLCVGFFNQFWQLDQRYQWLGDERLRAASARRRAPAQRSPPEGAEEVFLSDLMPTLIDQHKGPVNHDRSFQGRPLRIGIENRTYHKGLGLRAPSIVDFDIGGRFNSFRAKIGVDLEGEDSVSDARADSEWIQFVVYGDNKRLYMSDWLQWDSESETLDVPIEGVKVLRLEVRGSGARWLLGSAAWADAKVCTKKSSMMKRVETIFNQLTSPLRNLR